MSRFIDRTETFEFGLMPAKVAELRKKRQRINFGAFIIKYYIVMAQGFANTMPQQNH